MEWFEGDFGGLKDDWNDLREVWNGGILNGLKEILNGFRDIWVVGGRFEMV